MMRLVAAKIPQPFILAAQQPLTLLPFNTQCHRYYILSYLLS